MRGAQEHDGRMRSAPEQNYGTPRRPAASPVSEPRRTHSGRGGTAPSVSSSRSQSSRGPQQPSSRRNEYSEELEENQYNNNEVYDMYGLDRRAEPVAPNRRGPGSVRRGPSHRTTPSRSRYEEDDEYASDAYEGSEFDDEEEFEMLDSRSVRSGASRRHAEVKKVPFHIPPPRKPGR